MSKIKYEHLVRNVPNTENNRAFIKNINKMAKESKSMYKLFIKYRKPKEGFKYGSGGSLRCENANAFSVYIQDRRPYGDRPICKAFSRIHELMEENRILKNKCSILDNPFSNWTISDLNTELFELKETIIEKSLDKQIAMDVYYRTPNGTSMTLEQKYNLLMEALAYNER